MAVLGFALLSSFHLLTVNYTDANGNLRATGGSHLYLYAVVVQTRLSCLSVAYVVCVGVGVYILCMCAVDFYCVLLFSFFTVKVFG